MDKRLVRVTWLDASDPDAGPWYSDEDVDDFSEEEVQVISIGYIKSDTKLYLTLVADYIVNPNGTHTWGRPTKIPHAMISKIEDLTCAPSS